MTRPTRIPGGTRNILMPGEWRNGRTFLYSLPPSQFKAIRGAGWQETDFIDLVQKLNRTLDIFSVLVPNSSSDFAFSLNFHTVNRGKSPLLIDRQRSQIDVFLKRGVKTVLEQAPVKLAEELADLLCSESTRLDIPFKSDLFEEGIESVVNLFQTERRITVDKAKITEEFKRIFSSLFPQMARERFFSFLLQSNIPFQKRIEEEIDEHITAFRSKINQSAINYTELSVIGEIAHFAMQYVVAKKAGNVTAALKCRDIFMNAKERSTTDNLALIEMMFLGLVSNPDYQKPLTRLTLEFNRAARGFNVLFNLFERIFDAYYDRIIPY